MLGIGEYGRSFTLSSTANTGVGAPSSAAGNSGPYTQEAGMLGYNEVSYNLSLFFTHQKFASTFFTVTNLFKFLKLVIFIHFYACKSLVNYSTK